MLRLEHIEYLYLLLLIPALALLFGLFLHWRKKVAKRFGDNELVERLSPQRSHVKLTLKFSVLMLALALLILCIANPQMGSKVSKAERKGIDLMICLDVSKSMDAEDIQPSRLQRSKQSIVRLLDKFKSDRIGIVIFAGDAYTQLPLTNDYAAARLFINTITTKDLQTQGTAIGSAISLAEEGFDPNQKGKKNKAIIVISDGENHEDDAIGAARQALSNGIIVNTIGMGLPEGGPIPIYENGRLTAYKKDQNGQPVITKLNEKMLQDIAEAGGGTYVGANNTSAGVEAIFEKVSKLEKISYEAKDFSEYQTQYQYFLLAALILLIAEIFIFERKNKFFSNINLFGKK